MPTKKYMFKTPEKPYVYNPPPELHKYYQVCYFKHPKTGKYHIRKCVVNEKGEYANISERKYDDMQYHKFFKEHRDNEFKMYPTYDLTCIDYPHPGDILKAQSPLLNNDYDYTGYAKF